MGLKYKRNKVNGKWRKAEVSSIVHVETLISSPGHKPMLHRSWCLAGLYKYHKDVLLSLTT